MPTPHWAAITVGPIEHVVHWFGDDPVETKHELRQTPDGVWSVFSAISEDGTLRACSTRFLGWP
jgi:hypothetical protein